MKNKVNIEYVPTSENVADMFTKALGPMQFEKLRMELGVKDVKDAVERQGLGKTQEEEGVIVRQGLGKTQEEEGAVERQELVKNQGYEGVIKRQRLVKNQGKEGVVKRPHDVVGVVERQSVQLAKSQKGKAVVKQQNTLAGNRVPADVGRKGYLECFGQEGRGW
ncbi:hypothetical protein DVH05_002360 [Phytophthora capsici]|nr:hypothetical protein DVH05_002360 [Phytophthora capsici]